MRETKFNSGIGFHNCPADTFLLASFAVNQWKASNPPRNAIDLGCGPGRVLYELSLHWQDTTFYGLEIHEEFLRQAKQALELEGLAVRIADRIEENEGISLVKGSVAEVNKICEAGFFDAVFMNPPYFRQGEGRLPENPSRLHYRHECEATLIDFFKAADYLLRPDKSAYAVYPADRAEHFEKTILESPLRIAQSQSVYPTLESNVPRWILYKLVRATEWKECRELDAVKDPDLFIGYSCE